jgi:hypothetical protein
VLGVAQCFFLAVSSALKTGPLAQTNVPTEKKTLFYGDGLWLDSPMELEVESRVICPYCGAIFTTVVDTSSGTFSTIEDCEVCCRPIALNVHCHFGEIESVEFDRA